MLRSETAEEDAQEPVLGADAVIRAQMVCIHGLTQLITDRFDTHIRAKRSLVNARLQVCTSLSIVRSSRLPVAFCRVHAAV